MDGIFAHQLSLQENLAVQVGIARFLQHVPFLALHADVAVSLSYVDSYVFYTSHLLFLSVADWKLQTSIKARGLVTQQLG